MHSFTMPQKRKATSSKQSKAKRLKTSKKPLPKRKHHPKSNRKASRSVTKSVRSSERLSQPIRPGSNFFTYLTTKPHPIRLQIRFVQIKDCIYQRNKSGQVVGSRKIPTLVEASVDERPECEGRPPVWSSASPR